MTTVVPAKPRIIFPNDKGGVSVKIPTPDYLGALVNEFDSTLAALHHIAHTELVPGTPYQIVDASDIPADRTFRDAWEYVPTLNDFTCQGESYARSN